VPGPRTVDKFPGGLLRVRRGLWPAAGFDVTVPGVSCE